MMVTCVEFSQHLSEYAADPETLPESLRVRLEVCCILGKMLREFNTRHHHLREEKPLPYQKISEELDISISAAHQINVKCLKLAKRLLEDL